MRKVIPTFRICHRELYVRPPSFALLYLVGNMLRLAFRVFLLCWLLFSSNGSLI